MQDDTGQKVDSQDLVRLATDVVSAYVSFNTLSSSEIPSLIEAVYGSLNDLQATDELADEPVQKPAVPIRRSVQADYIVCLEDGKKLKMLKRYLRTKYDMSPEDYRRKWNLPADYPMVAPSYSSQRSAFAKQIGLGRRRSAA